jgi:hypothetical protein
MEKKPLNFSKMVYNDGATGKFTRTESIVFFAVFKRSCRNCGVLFPVEDKPGKQKGVTASPIFGGAVFFGSDGCKWSTQKSVGTETRISPILCNERYQYPGQKLDLRQATLTPRSRLTLHKFHE